MDAKKILCALDIYDGKLRAIANEIGREVSPVRQEPTQKYYGSSEDLWKKLSHVWWAVKQCREFVEAYRLEKAFRWLGFIQGALWQAGIYSIEELANHNKPDGEPTDLDPNRKSAA